MELVPQDNPATPRTPVSGASPLDDLVSPGARVLKAQALARAAYKGDLETVEELLDEGVSPNSKDAYGCPAVCNAAFTGQLQVLRRLHWAKANLNATDPTFGGTALMAAAGKGHSSCVELLITSGAEKDMAAKDGKTAFIVAALNGHEGCAKLLTENGADWKVEDGQGRSGLDYAEAADHKAIIALLNTGRFRSRSLSRTVSQSIQTATKCWCKD